MSEKAKFQLDEDQINDLIKLGKLVSDEWNEDHTDVLQPLRTVEILKAYLENHKEWKTEERLLENQEIWVKIFFNGYFYQFTDMFLNVEINEINPEFPHDSSFKGTTFLLPPLGEIDGKIDLTPLLFTLLDKIREKPKGKFKCYATGFGRKMKFDKELLSTPDPEKLLKVFGLKKISKTKQLLTKVKKERNYGKRNPYRSWIYAKVL